MIGKTISLKLFMERTAGDNDGILDTILNYSSMDATVNIKEEYIW
jgi:hypothetical protein